MYIPFRLPFVEATITDLLRPLNTRRKSSGEKGHPYLIPLSDLKKGDGTPLRGIENEASLYN